MIEQKDRSAFRRRVFFTLFTVLLSAFVFAFYRFSLFIDVFFPEIMWVYIIALAVLIFVYIFYNRGFLHKGITPEMLPHDWDDEKKNEFIEYTERRMRRSAWMLPFIIAFFATFVIESFELFVLPIILGWFR